ncbi:MAG TPA: superoxide dismutase family protein [Thermoanaerobaculia bacterium]|nr:superoxide dismutase family protein [Thermoanaerobaculia bacterium]
MRTGRAWTGRIDVVSLAGCALLAAGVLLAGCKKDEETVVQESETAYAAPTPAEAEPAPTMTSDIAGAQLSGPAGASGTVTFTQEAGGVHVVARIEGAKPGQHGFHLHAGGVCEGDFKSAGDHFNPTNVAHGDLAAPEHHAGDFGNVEVGADGTGNADFTTTALTLGGGGADDAIGKAVILHEGQDDLKTQPSGNSGARIACGIVQRAQGQAVTGEATPVPAATSRQY